MSWEEKNLANLRKEFVLDVEQAEKSFSAICRDYNITRRTGYKWYNRYLNNESLENRSKRPFHTPNKIDEDMEKSIKEMRSRHPYWGAKKIRKIMENSDIKNLPSVSTFTNVFRRNAQISKEESEKREQYIRFEKERPNEMWQMDFKGQFLLLDGVTYCFPLTIKDDKSRMGIATVAMPNQQTEPVKNALINAFKEYGMPESILSDNGKPWGNSTKGSYTTLEVWLMEQGILPIHCSIKHPQTQGKCENFNKILKNELLKYENYYTPEETQKGFDRWRNQYNTVRPHEALDMKTPSECYEKSPRKYCEKIEEYNYPENAQLLKVDSKGYIRINKKPYFFSEGFRQKYVALIENPENNNQLNIQFREFIIAKFDVKLNKITKKFARRINKTN